MRKLTSGIVALAAASVFISAAQAVPAVYTFDDGAVAGSASPGTPVTSSTTAGTLGQDNFIHTFGSASLAYIRNDAKPGFTGNWLSSYPTTPTDAPASDVILSRKNNANFSYSLTNTGYASFSADVLVGLGNQTAATPPVTSYRRSIVAPGIDNGTDGLRALGDTAHNAESAFQFGYESSTGIGWYIRGAGFGTSYPGAGTNIAAGVTGTWTTKLLVDFAANSGDGAGTLLIKQLYDGSGAAVSDSFHIANAALVGVNLQLKNMNIVANGGTATGSDPTTWNGFFARVANNGGIDNISFESITASPTYLAGTGSWFNAASWFAGIPNAVDATAELSTTGATIYADADVTIGKLTFSSGTGNLVTGTGTMTLKTSSGTGAINVTTGAHKVNIPLNIASSTTINVATGASLKISDPVTIQAGQTLTSVGAGTLTYEGSVTVLSGAAITLGGSQTISSLSLGASSAALISAPAAGGRSVVTVNALGMASGSKLDITANELRLNASVSDIRSAVHDGTLVSSLSDDRHGLGFGETGGGQVRVLYTLNGDANLDQKINFADLQIVAANFENAETTYTAGDFNADGVKNFADLFLFAQNYAATNNDGTVPAGASASFSAQWAQAMALAPEPTTIALLGLPLTMVARRRRA